MDAPAQSPELTPTPEPWTPDNTEAYLSQVPLPADFKWMRREHMEEGRERLAVVLPTYSISKGYGFWLRTTPYYPGLFELIHGILRVWPDNLELPSGEQLAERLNLLRSTQLPPDNLFFS